ncbi:MAG: DNA repair protein RecO [Alicyclobacillaceae bacterium]|nr:DNA repair protein RecO [Alicyclobacillaceae bacterium]
MLYNTEGIVVRTTAYGETHSIVTLLTPAGTVGAMAYGARKLQSRLAAGTQMYTRAVYTIYQRRGMGIVRQLEVVQSHRALREHLDLAAYAAYFCELALAAADERPHGQAGLYSDFAGALAVLDQRRQAPAMVARMWEAKVLRWLGAAPDWGRCVRCGRPLTRVPPLASDAAGSGAAGGHRPASGAPAGDIRSAATCPVYDPREGGLVCADCCQPAEANGEPVAGVNQAAAGRAVAGRGVVTVPVPAAVPGVLRLMSEVPWSRLGELRLSAGTAAAVNLVLRAQLLDYAGLSLKSRIILESLDLGEGIGESGPGRG